MDKAQTGNDPLRFPNYGQLAKDWNGGAFLICGGPSVSPPDLEQVREAQASGRVHILAVNSSYLAAPWADALVFTDWRWFDDTEGFGHFLRPEFWSFKGPKINAALGVTDSRLLKLRRIRFQGIQDKPGHVMVGCTTVSTALNVLIHKGVQWVGALGLDGKTIRRDGKLINWHHEPHPEKWLRVPGRFEAHARELITIAPQLQARGLEVFNCNPDTAHRAFPIASVAQILGRA